MPPGRPALTPRRPDRTTCCLYEMIQKQRKREAKICIAQRRKDEDEMSDAENVNLGALAAWRENMLLCALCVLSWQLSFLVFFPLCALYVYFLQEPIHASANLRTTSILYIYLR